MSGPTINRGGSEQSVETPDEFIAAVERKFGPLVLDLACTRQNSKAPEGIYYPEGDSLQIPWSVISTVRAGGLCWLNPEFANIARHRSVRWSGRRVLRFFCWSPKAHKTGIGVGYSPTSMCTGWAA